jgi:hypothetical protein
MSYFDSFELNLPPLPKKIKNRYTSQSGENMLFQRTECQIELENTKHKEFMENYFNKLKCY